MEKRHASTRSRRIASLIYAECCEQFRRAFVRKARFKEALAILSPLAVQIAAMHSENAHTQISPWSALQGVGRFRTR